MFYHANSYFRIDKVALLMDYIVTNLTSLPLG